MIVRMMALLNGCDFTIIAAARSRIIASARGRLRI
jgi:hypothetical protein